MSKRHEYDGDDDDDDDNDVDDDDMNWNDNDDDDHDLNGFEDDHVDDGDNDGDIIIITKRQKMTEQKCDLYKKNCVAWILLDRKQSIFQSVLQN